MRNTIFTQIITVALLADASLTSNALGLDLPHPTRPGPNADFPPFVSEHNGVFDYPWGAAHYSWPEQLFWDSLPDLRNQHLQDMIQAGDDIQKDGKAATMSCVAWGFEYGAASGGDSAKGYADRSTYPGWGQWGRWLAPRKDKYFAQDMDGKQVFPDAGYVTPLMPLDSVDWPQGISNATFGDMSGLRLGQLANKIHATGIFAADFVVGLYGSNVDFHPRVIDDFERWAGVTVPGTTVKARSAYIVANQWAKWNDFKAHRFARFYARIAETIRAGGREPTVGGQILPYAPMGRGWGHDYRIYLQHLPAKNWYFQVETQSDECRPVPQYWWASAIMGGFSARSPEFPLGAHMDAYAQSFWAAVTGGGKDSAWGRKYMKHAWLSVGWAHVANIDGSVRRATQAFQRAYWDGGAIDTPIVALVRAHIPRHPFGPAGYYSTSLERQYESTGTTNNFYLMEANATSWLNKGVPIGYYVSDTALANLPPENRPSSWILTTDNTGKTALTAAEKARLLAIAPILRQQDVADSCPLSFSADSLGGYGFIDQNGSVIVLSSNMSEKQLSASIRFAKVENGSYAVQDLLTGATTTLVVSGNKGQLPLKWDARDTKVLEIHGLRELGRKTASVSRIEAKPNPVAGIFRPDGKRIDVLGRSTQRGPDMRWSASAP